MLQHMERFESWWGWLTEFRVDGPGLQAGSVLRGVVVPPLPYRIRVQIELLECVRPERIDAAVHGDLEGRAQLLLDRTATAAAPASRRASRSGNARCGPRPAWHRTAALGPRPGGRLDGQHLPQPAVGRGRALTAPLAGAGEGHRQGQRHHRPREGVEGPLQRSEESAVVERQHRAVVDGEGALHGDGPAPQEAAGVLRERWA